MFGEIAPATRCSAGSATGYRRGSPLPPAEAPAPARTRPAPCSKSCATAPTTCCSSPTTWACRPPRTRPNAIWPSPRVAPYPQMQALALLALGLLAIVWAVSMYAYQVGADYATHFAADLPNHSAIVLYSAERIAIGGPGVQVAEIGQSGSKYHYQYSGIRLLVRSTDTYLLLPRYWQRGRDRVFIIREDDSIRMDVVVR